MTFYKLPALPALDAYLDALPKFFGWLYGEVQTVAQQLAAFPGEGRILRPAYARLGLRTLDGNSLEIIRFAASNRLCINLYYTDANGSRRSRAIQPCPLRETLEGNVILYAVKADTGQSRSCRLDRINSASITDRVFSPRYEIELYPTGRTPHIDG